MSHDFLPPSESDEESEAGSHTSSVHQGNGELEQSEEATAHSLQLQEKRGN